MLFKRCDFYNKLFILRFYYVCMFLNTWIYWGFKKPTVKSSSPKHCETGETKLCLLVFSSVKWVMVRPRESPSSLMLDDHVLLFLNLRHDIGLYFKQGCYWGSLFGGRKKKPNYLFLIPSNSDRNFTKLSAASKHPPLPFTHCNYSVSLAEILKQPTNSSWLWNIVREMEYNKIK